VNNPHFNYSFSITFKGRQYVCDVEGVNVAIISKGLPNEGEYEVLRNYIAEEGFIPELDDRKGIFTFFR